MAVIERLFHFSTEPGQFQIWWKYLDPLILTILVVPIFYILVLRPMKNQQEKLKRQTEELRIAAITFNSDTGVIVTDENFNILKVNNAFTKITGYSSKEVTGKTPVLLSSPRQDKLFFDKLFASLHKQKQWQGELWSKRKNGEIYPEWLTITGITTENGNLNYVGIFSDMSRMKEAEENFRRFFALTPEMACIVTNQGKFIKINNSWSGKLGYPEQEILAADFFKYIHPEDKGLTEEALKKLLTTDTIEFSNRFQCKNKQYIWLNWFLTRDQESKLFYASARDVTNQVNALNKLLESEERLSTIFDTLLEGVALNEIIFDDRGEMIDYKILEVNKAFYKVADFIADIPVIGSKATELYRMDQHTIKTFWQTHRGKNNPVYSEFISPISQRIFEIQTSPFVESRFVTSFHDITETRNAEKRVKNLAHFDQLTGLPNRILLNDRVTYLLGSATRKKEKLAVLFIDLDQFKNINDSLGHSIGDQFLMQMARRIKELLREEDIVSRQGGDEYIVVLPVTSAEGSVIVANKLVNAISRPIVIENQELASTASIGISIFPDDGDNLETLLRNADTAMYQAKKAGRNNFYFYKPEMQEIVEKNLKIASALRHALNRNELFLLYQPQIDIENKKIIGVEALLRWKHSEWGMVSPSTFIPVAEDTGQIISIGEWVLETALNQVKVWIDSGFQPIIMAVNLSAVQFRMPDLAEKICKMLNKENIPHELLELELTEAAMMDNPNDAIKIVGNFSRCGIKVAIDDFGTGYSSLNYLRQFKVDKIKIDQSFISEIPENSEDRAIVRAIISMSKSLGMKTIAEGVETEKQLEFLISEGCNAVQGYYFSKQLTADQIVDKYLVRRET
jgi:diguanylate cyclase (GGDEF)-like protein/PAS domain S-box-containing protein